MENKRLFRPLLVVGLLVLVGLSCSLLSNPVGSVAKQIETIVPNQTQIGSIVTQIAPNVTEVIGQLKTQVPALETAIPSILPGVTTGTPGQKPADIPVMDGNRTDISMSANAVIYSISSDLKTAVNFYKTEMPKNGWKQNTATSRESEADATLIFEKDNRQATVEIIDLFGEITVTIAITTK